MSEDRVTTIILAVMGVFFLISVYGSMKSAEECEAKGGVIAGRVCVDRSVTK